MCFEVFTVLLIEDFSGVGRGAKWIGNFSLMCLRYLFAPSLG